MQPPILDAVSYEVDVTGGLAELVIRQRFVNVADAPLDAIYTFPLDRGAAVDAMWLRAGEREIRAEVQRRDLALATYEAAADAGDLAALTEQQRPNVFSHRVANLPPGAPIEVELHVVQPLRRADGEWELVVPLVVAPRFALPGGEGLGDGPRCGSGVVAEIGLAIHAGAPLAGVWSPSVPLDAAVDGGEATARLEVPLTRDVIVRWRAGGASPALGVLVADDVAMLVVEPPPALARRERVPRELVWVLDTSCSMTGAPLALAKAAMRRALLGMDPRDSFVVLGFADDVVGGEPEPASPERIGAGLAFVDHLRAGGGTRLGDALSTALSWPADPRRRRTIVFVTDGLVSSDREVLETLGAHPEATFVALGIGAAPNRALLDAMAELGGGVAEYASLHEDPARAMARLVEAMDRPVWADVTVDWGDCTPTERAPERFPDVRVGRPARMLARLAGPCTGPIAVHADGAHGPVRALAFPQAVPRHRAMVTTWARERVADLERREAWGLVDDATDEIRALGLRAGIVTRETSLVAVQPSPTPSPRGPTREVALDPPDGMEWWEDDRGEELVVMAKERAVDWESTTRGRVLGRESSAPLPEGAGTWMLDGANVTDPVTGTFSANFDFDAILLIEVSNGGRMPEYAGLGRVVNVVTDSGTNNLESRFRVGGVGAGGGVVGGRTAGQLSGPVKRDEAWLLASAATATSGLEGVVDRAAVGFAKMTWQPTPEHRLALHGGLAPAALKAGGTTTRLGTESAGFRHQWFLTPDTTLDSRAESSGGRVGELVHGALAGASRLSFLSVEDPLGANHDLAVGAGADVLRWSGGGVAGRAVRLAAYAQDSAKLHRDLVVNGGVRADGRLDDGGGAVHASPRIFVAWDPSRTQHSQLAGGYARYVDAGRLLPGVDLPAMDELHATVQVEVVEDLALTADATASRQHLPFVAAPEAFGFAIGAFAWVDRRVGTVGLGFRKVESHRWTLAGSWTASATDGMRLHLDDPAAPWVPGLLEPYAPHRLALGGSWKLPTDPWTTTLGVDVGYASAIRARSAAWWLRPTHHVTVSVEQALDARKGRVVVGLAATHTRNDLALSLLPVEAYATIPTAPTPDRQPALRLGASLGYGF